ncbi:MAG TPA: YciI family protein [Alphaproteobacteria bacterium]|nr:YciI family protein [Alphaproteobacteria bacterium]
MRVMVFVKATKPSEDGQMPSAQLMADMGKFNAQLMAAGIMVEGGGLKPTSKGARVAFSGNDRSVKQGPFSNTPDIVSGFWIWNVKSLEEAIEWVKRCPNPMPVDSEIEIRPFYEMEDFINLG